MLSHSCLPMKTVALLQKNKTDHSQVKPRYRPLYFCLLLSSVQLTTVVLKILSFPVGVPHQPTPNKLIGSKPEL